MSLMPIIAPLSRAFAVLVSDTTTNVYPTLQNGDFGVLLEVLSFSNSYSNPSSVPRLSALSGWTVINNVEAITSQTFGGSEGDTQYGGAFSRVSVRALSTAQSGASIGSNAAARRLLVFRHPRALPLIGPVIKAAQATDGFTGSLNYVGQPNPILPLFSTAKVRAARNSLGPQPVPTLFFDGLAPTIASISTAGCVALVGFLTGSQNARSIAAALGATSSTVTSHAAINIRPTS